MNSELMFIGEIRTPYNQLEDCPSNITENGPLCEIIVNTKHKDGLYGLHVGKKILVLYWLDKSNRKVTIAPFGAIEGAELAGTFARRSPNRPNPIAVSTLKIERIEETFIFVKGLDCLDGTKSIDIKPSI